MFRIFWKVVREIVVEVVFGKKCWILVNCYINVFFFVLFNLVRCMYYCFNLGEEKIKSFFDVFMRLRDGVNFFCGLEG